MPKAVNCVLYFWENKMLLCECYLYSIQSFRAEDAHEISASSQTQQVWDFKFLFYLNRRTRKSQKTIKDFFNDRSKIGNKYKLMELDFILVI